MGKICTESLEWAWWRDQVYGLWFPTMENHKPHEYSIHTLDSSLITFICIASFLLWYACGKYVSKSCSLPETMPISGIRLLRLVGKGVGFSKHTGECFKLSALPMNLVRAAHGIPQPFKTVMRRCFPSVFRMLMIVVTGSQST